MVGCALVFQFSPSSTPIFLACVSLVLFFIGLFRASGSSHLYVSPARKSLLVLSAQLGASLKTSNSCCFLEFFSVPFKPFFCAACWLWSQFFCRLFTIEWSNCSTMVVRGRFSVGNCFSIYAIFFWVITSAGSSVVWNRGEVILNLITTTSVLLRLYYWLMMRIHVE